MSKGPTRDRVLRKLLSYSATRTLEPGDPFYRVWRKVWVMDHAEEDPQAAMRVFRIAARGPDQAWRAIELVEDSLDRLADLDLEGLVDCLVNDDPMEAVANEALEELLEAEGVDAARALVQATRMAEDALPAIAGAARILLDEDPEDGNVPEALALALHVDPDFASPILAKRFNNLEADTRRGEDFRRYVREFPARRVLEDLGADALERPETWQDLLARRHWRLLEDAEAVIDWLESTPTDPEGRTYTGQLLAHALSNVSLDTNKDLTERGIDLADELHDQFGDHDEEALKENKLNPDVKPEDRRLLAIKKSKDVTHPTEDPDTEAILETLGDYPETLQALGGRKNVKRDLGPDRVPLYAHYYEMDVQEQLEEYYALIEDSGEPNMTALWVRRRVEKAGAFRARWEERFRKLHENGVYPNQGRLWEDPTYWTELIFHVRLLDEFEEVVDVEDVGLELPGFGTSRPDFLVKSEDGDFVLEVTSIESSPDDVEEGVKSGLMLKAQNRLQDKLEGQLGGCSDGIEHPIVLGIEAEYEPSMELPGSLYGPLSFRWAQDPDTGTTVSEGATRDGDLAFFKRDNVDCITAVVGIAPEDPRQPYLEGDIYDPIDEPRHRLNPKLRVRLRTALFGPRPEHLVDKIEEVPSVTREEAEALVDHGLDHVSLLAADWFDPPEDLPMGEERFEEIVTETRRLRTLNSTGEIRYLAAAEDVDLEPFHEAEIFTLDHLLEAEERPEDVDEDVWAAMRAEAEQIRSHP